MSEDAEKIQQALATMLATSKGQVRFIMMGAARQPLTAEQLDKLGNAVEGIADLVGCAGVDVALALASVVAERSLRDAIRSQEVE